MRRVQRLLSRLCEYIGYHTLPQLRRTVVRSVDSFLAIDEAQRGAALEKENIAMAGWTRQAVLITVDADEGGAVRHQVDRLLHRPPLVIAQAVGPLAAGDFVVIGSAQPIELRGIHRISIRIEHRTIDA